MGSCAAPSAKGDDKFITTDYLQQCPYYYNGEEVIVEHFLARWFVALIFVPFLLIGTLADGFPSTWQELKKCLFPHRYGSLSADSWRVIPGKHSVDEQPIVDYWLKRMADAKKVD